MPALDQCHDQIVRALEKAGWYLERSPANFFTPYRTVFIDLEMSRSMNGNRQRIMLVEVKCFPNRDSTTRDLYISIGQYLIYRAILIEMELSHPLYLAIPDDIFMRLFDAAVTRVINDTQIKLVVVNLEMETITRWME